MNKGRQAPVTEEEIQDCEVFEQLRNSYHMTQKEWATAVGISYGLVKAIEQHKIKCSPKTKAKVHSFEIRYNSNQDAPDLYGLEAHILYDVLLSHMGHMPKREAGVCSARCTKALQDILAHTSELESDNAQRIYFQFMEQLLTMLALATNDVVAAINQGEDVLNINQGLKSIFDGKQITKFKKSGIVTISKYGEVTWQNNLFDFA